MLATSSERRKMFQKGWLGVSIAIFGSFLPTILFAIWLHYQPDLSFDDAAAEQWNTGSGLMGVRFCHGIVSIFEMIACYFGFMARRTVLGILVFFVAPIAWFASWVIVSAWYVWMWR